MVLGSRRSSGWSRSGSSAELAVRGQTARSPSRAVPHLSAGDVPVVVVRAGRRCGRSSTSAVTAGTWSRRACGNRETLSALTTRGRTSLDGTLAQRAALGSRAGLRRFRALAATRARRHVGPARLRQPRPGAAPLADTLGDSPASLPRRARPVDAASSAVAPRVGASGRTGRSWSRTTSSATTARSRTRASEQADRRRSRSVPARRRAEWSSSQFGPVNERNADGGKALPYEPAERCRSSQFHYVWPNWTLNVLPGPGEPARDRFEPDGPDRTARRTCDGFWAPGTSDSEIEEITAFGTSSARRTSRSSSPSRRVSGRARSSRDGCYSAARASRQHFQLLVHEALSQDTPETMTPTERRAHFRALHQRDRLFVMPNPWDIGSARFLGADGCRGARDDERRLRLVARPPRSARHPDELVAHVAELAEATALPLNVDSEGFSREPGAWARPCALVAGAGAAGCSIEDYDPATERSTTSASPPSASPTRQRPAACRADRADWPRREPHPRGRRPRRHDRPPDGLQGRRRGRLYAPGMTGARAHRDGRPGGGRPGERARAALCPAAREPRRGRRAAHLDRQLARLGRVRGPRCGRPGASRPGHLELRRGRRSARAARDVVPLARGSTRLECRDDGLNDLVGEVRVERRVSLEEPVKERAVQQVERDIEVGIGGDLAAVDRALKDLAGRFPPRLEEALAMSSRMPGRAARALPGLSARVRAAACA